MYYGDAKVLIERNRFRMISYFEERGMKYLLARAPQGVMRLVGGKINTIGVTMTEGFKSYMVSLIEADIEDYSELIPSAEFLHECIYFGQKNTDRIFGYGLALAMEKEDKTKAVTKEEKKRTIPSYKYVRRGGKIILIS